jgi:flagellar basal-body rod protein FlgG
MDRSLYVVASAMAAELARQQRIGNDLANTTTPGYKSEETTQRSFDDMLLFSRMSGQEVGPTSLGVYNTAPTLDLSQGPLEPTGEDLDLAIDGDGWFSVKTDKGTFFTRNGQFRTRPDGTMTTADGNDVLGTDGNPITVKPLAKIGIAADGTVSSDGKQVGKLAVVSLSNPGRGQDGLYTGTVSGPASATSQVRQGFLEGAKLDAATTMIDMIVSLRAFEAGQRVIKAADETLQRAISAGAATGG